MRFIQYYIKRLLVGGAFFLLFFCFDDAYAQLDMFEWEKRVLIVSAGDDEEKVGAQLHEFLSASEGFVERDVVVLRQDADKLTFVDGFSAGRHGVSDGGRYVVDANSGAFEVVLIGLDGGVKKIWMRHVEAQDVFDAIDAMPMRQRELSR